MSQDNARGIVRRFSSTVGDFTTISQIDPVWLDVLPDGVEGRQWDSVLRSSDELVLSGRLLYERLQETLRKSPKSQWKTDLRIESTFADVVEVLHKLEQQDRLQNQSFQNRKNIRRILSELQSYERGLQFLSQGHPELTATICTALAFLLQTCRHSQRLLEEISEYMTQTEQLLDKFMQSVHHLKVKPESVECVTGFYINFTDSLTEMVSIFGRSAFKLQGFIKQESFSKSDKIASYFKRMRWFVDRMNQLQSLLVQETVLGMEKSQNALAELLRATLSQVSEEREAMRLESMRQEALGRVLGGFETGFHVPKVFDPTNRPEQPLSGPNEVKYEHETLSEGLENIVNPPVEYLRQLHSLLPERCSYVGLDLLGTTEVANWVESNSSSLLWLEGYPTRAIFKWTTEFALDVVYAGQEKGYVVLYHFCDLIISAGKDDYIQQPTAILKSLLCLLHKQMAGNTHGQAPKDALRMTADDIVKLDTEKAWRKLSDWLGALTPGTVVYIVIDSIDTLHNWTTDFAKFTEEFVPQLSSLIGARNQWTTVKVLLTSLSPQTTEIFWPLVSGYKKDNLRDDIGILRNETIHNPGKCYLSRPEIPDLNTELNHTLPSFAAPSKPMYQSLSSDSDNESHKGERNMTPAKDPPSSETAGRAQKKYRRPTRSSDTESNIHSTQDSDTESEDIPRNKKSARKSRRSQTGSSDSEYEIFQKLNRKGSSGRVPGDSKASSNREGKKKQTSRAKPLPSEPESDIESSE